MNGLKSALLIISLAVTVSGQHYADLIIVNARVRTMDPRMPVAEAVAVLGDRIIAVGPSNKVRSKASTNTKIVDAGGKLVIPGFNDAHVHFTGVGNWFSHLDASRITSFDELLVRVAYFTKFLPDNRWVLGAKLTTDESFVNSRKLELLDAVSPNHPILMYLANPSMALVNSTALKSARISLTDLAAKNTDVRRDALGRATGIVSGAALSHVRKAIPSNNSTNWSEILRAASNYAASLGVTSVQDVHSDNFVPTYKELARNGKLKTRIYDCIGLGDWEKNTSIGSAPTKNDAMVRSGCVKWLADGAPDEREGLAERVAKADKAGMQIMIHAIGGAANKNTIDAFESAAAKNGSRDRRFRIEHAHLMRNVDILRLSRLGVIPSMQPALFYRNGDSGGDDFNFIFRSGAKAAFGSDASMIDIDPLAGIHAAVNSGRVSITVEQAVYAYTAGSAFAEFQEQEKGTLSVGKLADIVMLKDDIFTIDPRRIRDSKVAMTILGGKLIYQASAPD